MTGREETGVVEPLAERGVAPAGVVGAVLGAAVAAAAGGDPAYREVLGAAAVTLGSVAAAVTWWAAAQVAEAVARAVGPRREVRSAARHA